MMFQLSYFIGTYNIFKFSILRGLNSCFFLFHKKNKISFSFREFFFTTDSIDLSLDNILLYTLLVTDLVPEIGFTETRNQQKNWLRGLRMIPQAHFKLCTQVSGDTRIARSVPYQMFMSKQKVERNSKHKSRQHYKYVLIIS